MVLVPGLGLDERSSTRLRQLVSGAVVCLPGMGRRGPVPDLPALVAELRSRLGPGPVVLVGHSQGCQVAAAAAGDPRVAALVLLGPTTDARLRSPRILVGRWLRTAVREPWTAVPRVVAQWLRTGPRAMTALWRRASPDRIEARLRTLGVPVVVVRGTRDRLCPHDWAASLAAVAPRGRLVELPGAAHMTVQTRPEAVARLLLAVRSSIGGGGRTADPPA